MNCVYTNNSCYFSLSYPLCKYLFGRKGKKIYPKLSSSGNLEQKINSRKGKNTRK